MFSTYKSVYFLVLTPITFAYSSLKARKLPLDHDLVEAEFANPPPGFPSPNVRLHGNESRVMADLFMQEVGNGLRFLQKHDNAVEQCDAMLFKSCREMDGVYCDFVEKNFYNKPILLAGPAVPKPHSFKLDNYFDKWLSGFSNGNVVYCALGSECFLQKAQFDELVIGLELTGRPFLAALKPPIGYETIESALPEGFEERTKGRGIVCGSWVQQQLLLQHSNVGCFVTHCGAGSMTEAIVSDCQLVLIPQFVDQVLNARMMSLELRVGVEVEKREVDGFVDREAVHKAVELVMDDKSEVGIQVRKNHAKWREILLQDGLEESYIGALVDSFKELVG